MEQGKTYHVHREGFTLDVTLKDGEIRYIRLIFNKEEMLNEDQVVDNLIKSIERIIANE